MSDDAAQDSGHIHQDGIGEPDQLERLWTPHRMAYIRGESKPLDDSEGECPFCRIPLLEDEAGLVVHRGSSAYVVLNLYPYNSGHVMVCPFDASVRSLWKSAAMMAHATCSPAM